MVIPVLYAKAFERIFSTKQNKPSHKVQIMITPADKVDSYKPIKLQLSVHACFELSKRICRKPQFKWHYKK
jgi:hypothetical protein